MHDIDSAAADGSLGELNSGGFILTLTGSKGFVWPPFH